MASDSGKIVDQLRRLDEDFRTLVEMVTGPDAMECTAAKMELRIFREVLALGRQLLEVFFTVRASKRPTVPMAAEGTPLSECHRRRTTYLSVFGKIQFKRHRFHAAGQAGQSPLDAELSLPERCYSAILRDWVEYDLTDTAYDESAKIIERILGIDISKNALETLVGEDAADVDAFYDQKPIPAVADEGPILVIQADGAGVRLVGTAPSERTGHRTSKREAVVTAVYTIGRHVRTPQAMAAALMRRFDVTTVPAPQPVRPAPVGKESRATLYGKDAAFEQLSQRVAQRDGAHIEDRVALTDGAEALQERMLAQFPDFTLVLDIIHVLDYLWAAANAIYAGRAPDACRSYVHTQLEVLLCGQTQAVIDDLTHCANTLRLTRSNRTPVDDAVRYFTRNAPLMRYDLCLARGWPIATGVIEGGCKHLVRGRMERSGMKWTRSGAQAMLDLRAVRINGDWDDYQLFRRHQEHQRLYGRCPPSACPEAQAVALAA